MQSPLLGAIERRSWLLFWTHFLFICNAVSVILTITCILSVAVAWNSAGEWSDKTRSKRRQASVCWHSEWFSRCCASDRLQRDLERVPVASSSSSSPAAFFHRFSRRLFVVQFVARAEATLQRAPAGSWSICEGDDESVMCCRRSHVQHSLQINVRLGGEDCHRRRRVRWPAPTRQAYSTPSAFCSSPTFRQ